MRDLTLKLRQKNKGIATTNSDDAEGCFIIEIQKDYFMHRFFMKTYQNSSDNFMACLIIKNIIKQ